MDGKKKFFYPWRRSTIRILGLVVVGEEAGALGEIRRSYRKVKRVGVNGWRYRREFQMMNCYFEDEGDDN